MSHALLLRLFLSPSFFTVHVALQYLQIYAGNIGITYYLTRRLRELDTEELREVWGFICHLLVTKPSESRALECFVVEIAHKSTHIAMLTLWYMQAYLKDIGPPSNNPPSFMICQRVLHECHELIFGDIPPQSTAPYSSIHLPTRLGPIRRKVRPHVQPALVGIGMMLAGIPVMPQLTEIMGEVAIEQGRVDEEGQDIKSLERAEDDIVRGVSVDTSADAEEGKDGLDGSDEEADTQLVEEPQPLRAHTKFLARELVPGSRRQTVAAQTSPALPMHLKGIRRYRLSEDPFGQQDTSPPTSTPFQSTPTFSVARHRAKTMSIQVADLLQKYDFLSQVHLLRSHYCRSEIKFLLALENISNRLLVVPRPARISALRAELTGLNHVLPAEVCMPMWCGSSDTPVPPQGVPQPHHRIVRIPPGESVVLNSAERAPYLLLIEILHGDLDFDPAKRNNKEILKKIVLKEAERKGSSKDFVTFTGNLSAAKRSTNPPESATVVEETIGINNEDVVESPTVLISTFPPTPVSPTPPEDDEEEIDLVEQLYGEDNSLLNREADLSDSIVLPPPPKNKELDMATWSRSNSIPPTPAVESDLASHHYPTLDTTGAGRLLMSSTSQQPNPTNGHTYNGSRALSMDEYSERMRTAAVMLAQLNANLMREASPLVQTPSLESSSLASPFRWLTDTPILTVTPGNDDGPSTPAPSSAPVPAPMKLQPTEAAAIRERIMGEMLALEEERMARMREGESMLAMGESNGGMRTAEDERIIRKELSKADPSAAVFSESWAAKKSRIRQSSPYGHLATWDCASVIVKTGGDLRQEQLAVQLIQEFDKIWKEENCPCWVRYFRILITGSTSGLVETITDAVSIHSIKKAEYARRLAQGRLGHVSIFDHFRVTYGDPSSAKFARAQRNFAKSLAGYSLVTYFLQIKDRHNGNILLDRDGHLIHIDFGFMLSNSPGNIGFEAAPFKLPFEYIEVLGGINSKPFMEFKRLFREGFEAARKHCDRIVTLVELMQKDSTLPCFVALGEQTSVQLRERFVQGLTQIAVVEHVNRLIESSLGSNWTRLYDSYQYYSQSIF
ncbi:kinase-like protein [Laetiporus sulphureus 93-53]|uniref:1-phosphatidylinositol 4-kinase n=1 Tax=Laetiporus sulphureus 93-53 TaxID=1314785 RepID=A0A165FUF9_9APHY|nr:kinase-like protein [Laetiporus sulphureus 93-53]KZT09426.1 kinase-like protein [Laetiporus sulphureus 93-53]